MPPENRSPWNLSVINKEEIWAWKMWYSEQPAILECLLTLCQTRSTATGSLWVVIPDLQMRKGSPKRVKNMPMVTMGECGIVKTYVVRLQSSVLPILQSYFHCWEGDKEKKWNPYMKKIWHRKITPLMITAGFLEIQFCSIGLSLVIY